MSIETLSYDEAREIVERAKDTRDVIQLGRIGATPYLRYTPYTNSRGVTVGLWSCISIMPDAMPDATLLFSPHIVRPWEHDDWEINQIHTPWVVHQVANTHRDRIQVQSADETPFVGEILRWDTDDEGGDSE